MECLPNQELIITWIMAYGGFALFGLLALGIIALPIPEETLMVIAGGLVGNGILNPYTTFFAAFFGSMFGISVSYLIGKTAGIFFLEKYGSWFGLTKDRLIKAHNWFGKYGKWTLVFGYFIPGLRHFTGIAAGAAKLEYRNFALYAYCGDFLWVSTFLSIGFFLGDYCLIIFETLEKNIDKVIIVSVLLLIAAYAIKKATQVYAKETL